VIKDKKLVLKDCDKHLKNFRDGWELVGIPPPQLAQIMEREHSEDEEDEERSMNMLREKTREMKRKREGES
jgi:hypothetical protein